MLRSLTALVLLGAAGAAHAQEAPPVYQQQKSKTGFHADALARQEWTDDVTFLDTSRRFWRLRPRVEFTGGWLQAGVGGDFTYASDQNTDPPEGTTTPPPILRDNYKSRNARLDLAWARLSPVKAVSAQGGRFMMPVRLTEMIWDRDLRVQGASATIDLGSIGPLQRLAATGVWARGSHILPEEGAFKFDNRDTVWAASATMIFSAGAQDRIELVGSYLKFEDLEFVDPRLRRQNTRVGGALVLPYEVWDLVARYHGEGRVSTTIAVDYAWNRATARDNRGIWAAILLGSTVTARGSLEYTYAAVDKDVTLAAYAGDDFIWGTGWSGHRLDLGVRMSDRSSSHVVGQLQKFKDSPVQLERDDYKWRIRLEVRAKY
jgi:hypothetical protein